MSKALFSTSFFNDVCQANNNLKNLALNPKCKKDQPLPLSVKVLGCEESPCDVVKGSSLVMLVDFEGTKDEIRHLNARLSATFIGITVPYELQEDVADVCSNLMYNATCPIYKSEKVTYQFIQYIDVNYPEISVAVELSLNDDNNESVACFITNINIVKDVSRPLMLE